VNPRTTGPSACGFANAPFTSRFSVVIVKDGQTFATGLVSPLSDH
jgi:hypothetical protein